MQPERKIRGNKDNQYLDIVVTADPLNLFKPTPAQYRQSFTRPILDNPSDYYLTCVDFSIPLETIPIFTWPVDTTQTDPRISNLIIGIQDAAGAQYPERVIYVPNSNRIAPSPNATAPYFTDLQVNNEWWFVYNISQMITMINTALSAAVTASGIGGTAPYYSWNPVTQLISLTTPSTFPATLAQIFVNSNLQNYLSSFQWYFFLGRNGVPTYFYQVLTPLPAAISSTYTYTEDYVSIALWFDLRKIYVTTSIPTASVMVPSDDNQGIISYLPTIIDYIVNPFNNNTNTIQTIAVYNSGGTYRLTDLTGNSALSNVSLDFWYVDKYGNSRIININPSQEIKIQLGFLKRELYNNDPYSWGGR